ncbi:hypothetical protein IQ264_01040 [Phormidium sp. LEGE 05292]|nr:hypothetical protein [Phormidium sp. LEGE 05292]
MNVTLPATERFFYAYYMSTSRQQTSQNLPTPRRYIRQTVSLPVPRTEAGINVLTLRKLLGINTRDTINAHLKALGYFRYSRYEEKILSWSQVKDVLGLHLWLRLGISQHLGERTHTRKTYIALKDAGLAEQALLLEGIDLEKQFQELKNEYQQRTSTSKF